MDTHGARIHDEKGCCATSEGVGQRTGIALFEFVLIGVIQARRCD